MSLQFSSSSTEIMTMPVRKLFNLCCSWLGRNLQFTKKASFPLLFKRRGQADDKILGRRQLRGSGLGRVLKESNLHGLPKAVARLPDF